jgi:hypothetical protein
MLSAADNLTRCSALIVERLRGWVQWMRVFSLPLSLRRRWFASVRAAWRIGGGSREIWRIEPPTSWARADREGEGRGRFHTSRRVWHARAVFGGSGRRGIGRKARQRYCDVKWTESGLSGWPSLIRCDNSGLSRIVQAGEDGCWLASAPFAARRADGLGDQSGGFPGRRDCVTRASRPRMNRNGSGVPTTERRCPALARDLEM